MNQITARLPDAVLSGLDEAAVQLRRSRADVVGQAIDRYLEDFDDLTSAVERFRDPSDPVLDWERVRHELLDSD
jgi:transposase